MSPNQSFIEKQLAQHVYHLIEKPGRMPQNEDIREAKDFFEQWHYDPATVLRGAAGFYSDSTLTGKEAMSPALALKNYQDMSQNIQEYHAGDFPKNDSPYRFKESFLFDWPSIASGTGQLREQKRREQVFGDVSVADPDKTRVKIGDLPEAEGEYPFVPDVDVETPEGRKRMLDTLKRKEKQQAKEKTAKDILNELLERAERIHAMKRKMFSI